MSNAWSRWKSMHTPANVAFKRPWPTTLRGFILWLFALGFIWVGVINYIATPLPPTTRDALSFALSFAPQQFWGWLLVALGTLAVYTSYCHLGRDRLGFIVLAVWCAAWGVGYLCGWLFYDAPLRSVGGMVIWALYAGILASCAAIPTIGLGRSDEVSPICHPSDGDL